ncbi:hypothetical protein [Paraburkholderia tropica]|uniref:hypothetical protein n=1 Tax=Paraburkholderia tropica TaxID=92647 RepID=UPI002AB05BCA|nr:hypothetical protein [Paraburkholderia tropica]
MAYEPRIRAVALAALEDVSPEEHATLKAGGAADAGYWETPPAEDRPFYKRFKAEVKDYYRSEQGRRCCYCSFELADDHSTFDAEHVLDKSTHPQFMFDLNNLAAACRPCNRAKNAKPVVNDEVEVGTIPFQSDDYRIVHPHLDEWTHHLRFDELNRIRPIAGSFKGKNTIEICKIDVLLNAARLADGFSSGRRVAETHLRRFYEYKRISKKKEHLELLRALATQRNLAGALAIVQQLEQEVDEEEAVAASLRQAQAAATA